MALRAPVAVGWNVTVTLQDVDCVSVVHVFAVMAKSAVLLFAAADTLTVPLPMLVSVSVSGALVVPTAWLPKANVPDPCN